MSSESSGTLARFRQLPPTTRRLLGVHLLNSLGSGLVVPFLAIYATHTDGGDAATGGLALVTFAVGSLAANSIAGGATDRFGPGWVLRAGWLINAGGNICLVLSHTRGPLLVSTAIIGIGAGLAYPALRTLIALVTPEPAQPMAFSAEHVVLNVGFSVGALIAAIVVGAASLTQLRVVYLLDAVSFLIVVAVLPLVTQQPPAGAATSDDSGPGLRGSYRTVLADRAFVRLCTIQGLLVVFGYAQFDAVVPLWLTRPEGIATRLVAVVVAANTIVVSLGALPVANATRRRRRSTLVATGSAMFALSWLILPLSALTTGAGALVVAIVAAVTMGLAECLLAPALGPMVNALAPDHLRGRYNAADAFTLSAGTIIGPALSAALIVGSTSRLFAALALGCSIAALLASRSITLRTL